MGHYLVTGAAGYIGSVLCKRLKEEGHTVSSVDTKDTKPIYSDNHFFRTCFSSNVITNHVINNKIDGIFHLAAHSLLGPSVTAPIPYFINNAGKLATFVNDLIEGGWKGKFVFASTAATYGAQDTMVNEDSPKAPINPYGASKLQAEQILEAASKAHGFSSVIFRFFNVAGGYGDVGQGLNEPHILTQLSKAGLNNTEFNIYGQSYDTPDGTCIRDYVHVLDVVNSHLLAIDILDKTTGCLKFNLGTSKGTSNKELVNMFKTVACPTLAYCYADQRPGDPDFLVADSSRFSLATGYTFPNSTLNNIISSHWDYYNYAKS